MKNRPLPLAFLEAAQRFGERLDLSDLAD